MAAETGRRGRGYKRGNMARAREKIAELSPAKRHQILVGARQVFIELGFERTSVSLIAERAGVSKATLYNHFEDKVSLFTSCLGEECEEAHAALAGILEAPSGDLEAALFAIGEKVHRLLISPTTMALHRIIVAEAHRFPEVGQQLYDMIARYTEQILGGFMKMWSDRGALHVEDPVLAANQFVDLCRGDAYKRVELGIAKEISDEEVRATVAAALRTFLRAYRA
jgi:TetR/AcrR family transcriptional repressor of mexJK operon